MIKFLKSMAIPTAALVALPGIASASVGLAPDDFVGISFWVISMCMVAATAFFFLETNNVSGKWKTSLALGGLVCLVAAVHYFYMREVWVTTGDTPTVYRYVDWLITVPLQMIEFYIILLVQKYHLLLLDDEDKVKNPQSKSFSQKYREGAPYIFQTSK